MEKEVSWAATVPLQINLAESSFVRERVAHAARSVLTRSAQQREKAGAATTESPQLPCQRVLASLTDHVLPLLDHPMKIPDVPAVNHQRFPSLAKTMDAQVSGAVWVPVSMCPAQTGQMWMPTSTSVFPDFLASVVPSLAVSVFRRRSPVLTKDAPDSLAELVFASTCLTLNLPKRVLSLILKQAGEENSVLGAAPASKRKVLEIY